MLRCVKVSQLQVKDFYKVINVIMQVCHFDAAIGGRIFDFMGKVHKTRETEELYSKAKADRQGLLNSVWALNGISKGSLRLIHDLTLQDPNREEKSDYS